MPRSSAAGCLALLVTTAMPAGAAPYMIVGNDEKPGTDAQGKPVVNPAGNDTVVIFDLAKPEEPKIVATLKLENSIVGPPTNLDIAPNGSIALVADAMTVAEEDGARKTRADRQAVRHRPQGEPAGAGADRHRRQAAVRPVVQPEGRHGVGRQPRRRHDQRAEGRRHQRDADRHRADRPGVSHVVFTPDGKHALALKSPDNKVAVLDIDGGKVTYNKLDMPTYPFPYNIVVSPDSKLAITADNGGGGSSDGNADAVTRDRPGRRAPARDRACHGGDAPEGLAMSPKGNVAVAVNVDGSNMKQAWFHHPNGSVTVLRIQGKTVTPIETIEVGAFPEPRRSRRTAATSMSATTPTRISPS